jgi:hypothetical protein
VEAHAELLLPAPPDAVPVFDGVVLAATAERRLGPADLP